MKNLLSLLLILTVGFVLVVEDAEARRFGGGRSFGKSSPNYTQRQAAPAPSRSNEAAKPVPARPAQAAPGARRWLGPLAGMLAGGLLASLLFGDMFNGFQPMDFLVIAALVGGGFYLFNAMRRRGAANLSGHRYASAGPALGSHPPAFKVPEIGSALGQHLSGVDFRETWPIWFNEERFIEGAKAHFVSLQAAWDANDMKTIQEYTTPELFADLTRERANIGADKNVTEVVYLNAELLGVANEDDKVFAGVRYSGLIREGEGEQPRDFVETWHVQRSLSDPNADWYIAGIQQG
jgi:predicted lipid-binding transport protein (Tim44 family)